jgi:hypothetical protein
MREHDPIEKGAKYGHTRFGRYIDRQKLIDVPTFLFAIAQIP